METSCAKQGSLFQVPYDLSQKVQFQPYQRDFGDAFDFVSFRHNEGGYSRCCDCGAHGESLLICVEAVMPSSPRLGRREHSPAAAHVPVGSLAGPVSSAASNARDSSHGPTCAPRGSRRLVTSFLANLYPGEEEIQEAG